MVTLLLAAMAATPTAQCTKGSEDVPPLCPARLPAITSITIENNGARAWQEPQGPKSCAPFRLSNAQVLRYFHNAKATDKQSVDATLARAPCYVGGHIRFANGRSAAWRIEQYGVAWLDYPRNTDRLLYCPTCTFDPFLQ